MTLSSLPVSYCTNVHPGRTVAEVVRGLTDHTAVAQQNVDQSIAAGLWFSATAAEELTQSSAALELLAQTLWQHDLSCYTLNTFPFGDFHSDRVKETVYLPDWTTSERANYTMACARILAQLLPPNGEGSLSTVPLGGSMNPNGPNFHDDCIDRLLNVAQFLETLQSETGRTIRLAVEPEPMCHLSSTTNSTLPFFQSLFQEADKRGCEVRAREFLGLCFDICHQAVEFEDVAVSINDLHAAGIRLNKIHVSSAVELINPAGNAEGRTALRAFVEPRYLHQTYAKYSDGRVLNRTDLLRDDIDRDPPDEFMQAEAWRVHFHVPIDKTDLGPLATTRQDVPIALKAVRSLPYAPHLEVETYTWPLMPGAASGAEEPLAVRIARELNMAYGMIAAASASDSVDAQ